MEHDRRSTMRDRQADRDLGFCFSWESSRNVCVFHMETNPEGDEGKKDSGAGVQLAQGFCRSLKISFL